MAKYWVTYGCGHRDEVQLYGPDAERMRRIDWLGTTDCPDCRQANRDAQAKAAAATAAAEGMARLTGSEKQIAWAEQVRVEILANIAKTIDAGLAQMATNSIAADIIAERQTLMAGLVAKAKGINSVAWWIDNRHLSPKAVLVKLMKEGA